MIYLTDFLFFLLYLSLKERARRFMDCKLRQFVNFRKYFYWFEYMLVIGYQYVKPNASNTERMVSFCMSVATCIAFDYLVTKKKII